MREMKFRAWDKTENRMHSRVESGIYQDPDEIIPFDNVLDFASYEVMQYTGLKDTNGKEIYEGDIVMQNSEPKDLGQVCFGEYGVRSIETEEVIDNAVGWYLKVLKTDAMSEVAPFCYDRVLNEYWIEKLNAVVVDNIYDRTEFLTT